MVFVHVRALLIFNVEFFFIIIDQFNLDNLFFYRFFLEKRRIYQFG